MQKKLPKLTREMVKNGYPAIQDFKIDGHGRYHLFGLIGNENKPGFYSIELTASGLSADYGDSVSGNHYSWMESAGGPLSPEEAEELERQQDKASDEFEAMLQRRSEKFAREMELCWNEGKELKSHQDPEIIMDGDNDQDKKAEALQVEIKKMAGLDALAQEIERNRLSEKYGIRKIVIDRYLARQPKENGDTKKVVDELLPAEEPVDGEKLLNGILAELSVRVVLPEQAAETITLWVLLTYCHEAFSILPLLGITSPVKRCGKTTLIEILQGLVNKGLAASSITPAAAFRTIEKYCPTLLIDEADTFLKNNDELRGIFNSGHTRASAFVIRVEGDDHEPVKFSTWAPKAIGMIGTLPDTIEDRSIVISLRRKLAAEKIIRTGLDFAEKSADVRAGCRRWADDHIEQLKAVRVTVPASGNDRADDNWSPLFAIAEVVGGSWPEKVKTTMAALVRASDDEAIGSKLLGDIKGVFEAGGSDKIFSHDLVEALKDLPESPWADWSRGKGLTTNWLGRLLKPFNVKSKTMRIDEDRFKGYSLESFQDAFKRYIPPIPSVTPCQFNDFNNLGENQNVTQDNDVTDEIQRNHSESLDCHDVTDEMADIGGKKKIKQCFQCPAHDKAQMVCYAASYFKGKAATGVPCKTAVESCSHFERTV